MQAGAVVVGDVAPQGSEDLTVGVEAAAAKDLCFETLTPALRGGPSPQGEDRPLERLVRLLGYAPWLPEYVVEAL